jgi:hypothetical protein
LAAIVGLGLAAAGLGRFLTDRENADGTDVVLLIVAFVVNAVIVAPNAAALDFIVIGSGSGATYTYTGMWPFVWVFYPIGFLCFGFTFIAMIKAIQVSNAKKALGLA